MDGNRITNIKSADFGELPLATFDWERSRDLDLDNSWEELNIEVSKLLNEDYNLNCSSLSQKKFRWRSSHPFIPNAERTKTQLASGSSMFFGATNTNNTQQNSAQTRKPKCGKELEKIECFNFSPLLIAGSHGGKTVWTWRLNEHRNKKDDKLARPEQTPVCANLLKIPRLMEKMGEKMKATSSQTPEATESAILRLRQKNLLLDKEAYRAVPLQTSSSKYRAGISKGNFEPSLDFLVWNKDWLSIGTEYFRLTDDNIKNHRSNPDTEKVRVGPSLSSVPTARGHMWSYDARFMAPNSSPCTPPFVSSGDISNKGKPSNVRKPFTNEGKPSNARKPFTNARGEVISLTMYQIEKRLRQLIIGKQTAEYINYVRTISKSKRCSWHPKTPDVQERISKRRFNGKVNVWRRKLHFWDVPISFNSLPDRRQSKVLPRAIGLKTECSAN